MRGRLLAIGLLTLAGCSPHENKAPQKHDIDAARAMITKPREQIAEEMSQTEYRSYRSLMAFSGLDEALGGTAQGDAALRGLMLQYRRSMLGARADMPRLTKAANSGDAPGFLGLGASFFVGSLTTGAMVSLGGGKESSGKIGQDTDGGSFSGSFDQGGVTSSSTFQGEVGGMTGRITTKMTLDTCPKPDGAINVDFTSDSSLTKTGGGAGANVKVTGKVTWYVSDNADFGDDFVSDVHVENAAFGGASGVFVDYSEKTSSMPGGTNSGVVNRASSKAAQGDVTNAQAAASFARRLVMASALQAREAFQSGRCIKLDVTSAPAKRGGVKPSTSFALLAAPRSKIDGTPTGGTVKADLSGEGKLDPAGAKAPADAKFTYVAPNQKDRKGEVAFEARSKRGIGLATLAFDTGGKAFMAAGGADAFHGVGKICDLSQPFEISGGGVTNKFTPSNESGGSYSYSGQLEGFAVSGAGAYKVSVTEDGGTLTATGPGSVKTPMGVMSNNGTETYRLTPISSCEGN